jgi:pimeloyl-ACP methyl ester carboxylesterase
MKNSKLFLVCLFALSFFLFSGSRVNADTAQCQTYSVPVTLSELNPTVYHVQTWLCAQGNLEGKTVQVLVHGFSYDHTYWDFPYQQPTYSYVQSATDAGYATLNLDLIGVGQSDHPLPELVNLQANSYVIHQIVQQLRAGSIGGTSFSKVITVGHSLGTLYTWHEASTYADVDGMMATGLMHSPTPGILNLALSMYPAILDPKFSSSGLPVGYVTTQPNTRGSSFYYASNANAQVIALDETLKETGTDGALSTSSLAVLPTVTQAIHVPVLVAVGQKDSFFCNFLFSCANGTALVQREQSNYSADTCLEGYSLTNGGHDINLHLNAGSWFSAANDWANRRVGNSASTAPTQPCP